MGNEIFRKILDLKNLTAYSVRYTPLAAVPDVER
jgi:hypothetical protein